MISAYNCALFMLKNSGSRFDSPHSRLSGVNSGLSLRVHIGTIDQFSRIAYLKIHGIAYIGRGSCSRHFRR